MRSMLPEMYEEIKSMIKEDLVKADRFALTSDIWTSRQTFSYLTISLIAPGT